MIKPVKKKKNIIVPCGCEVHDGSSTHKKTMNLFCLIFFCLLTEFIFQRAVLVDCLIQDIDLSYPGSEHHRVVKFDWKLMGNLYVAHRRILFHFKLIGLDNEFGIL